MIDPDFTTSDVFRILGVPRERLKDWMDKRFVSPSMPAKSQGIAAVFTRQDLYLIKFFSELTALGLKREQAGSIKDAVLATGRKPELVIKKLRQVHVIFTEDKLTQVSLSESFEAFSDKLPIDWLTVISVNFDRIKAAVDSAINGA